MKKILIKDIMIPLEEYATIHQDATLLDAVMALEKAQKESCDPQTQYPHRAILVYDSAKRIVGKLSQLDILRALEPKYRKASASDDGRVMTSGFSAEFLKSMVQQFALWDQPLNDICKKAVKVRAKDCMYVPEEGEYVKASDTLAMGIHQLVMGRHQSLLVTGETMEEIVGILRLTDVFKEVLNAMKACNL